MSSENESEMEPMGASSTAKAGNGLAKTGNGGSPKSPNARTQLATIDTGNRGLVLRNLDDMWRFATAVVKGGMCPRSMSKPEQVLIALQMGAEVGLTPMQSLKNIAVVDGSPCIWGDALVALVRRSPICKSLKQPRYEGKGETRVCIINAERINGDTAEGRFGYADAKIAGLLSRNTYKSYPDRMYYHRAVGYVAHELFPDLLMGLNIAEELQDVAFAQTTATIESGDDAPLNSLDEAADLLERDLPIEAEFEPSGDDASDEWPDNPSAPTQEEMRELFS